MGDYIFTTLNDPSAAFGTFATGINKYGQIVGYYVDASGRKDGFIYSAGSYTQLIDPSSGVTDIVPLSINDSGQISGYEVQNGVTQGFVYNGGSQYSSASSYYITTSGGSLAVSGINNGEEIVGYYTNNASDTNHGFSAQISQFNSSGNPPFHGTISTSNFTTLNEPQAGTSATFARGVNNQNQVIGSWGVGPGGSHGFFYDNGAYSSFDDPNGSTVAYGINDADMIVGYYIDVATARGFLYNRPTGTYTTINIPGALNTYFYGLNDAGQIVGAYTDGNNRFHGFLATLPPTPPPAGTTADMILRRADGSYEIYNIGNNAILAAQSLGQVGTDWQFVGVRPFYGSDASDMLLRSSTTGGFEVYDISNNQITGAAFMGTVGLNWQFSGVGNFSGRGESDMLLRNSTTGGLEVYDIDSNQITGAAFIGTIGLDWQFSGVGNFSGVAGETDLLLRNSNTGGLEVYDIANNQLTGAAFIGTVGLDWQFAGIAPIHAPGASDLVLRNVNSGAFEVYDIANNQLTGAASLGSVGLDWQLGGFAADPPTGSMGSSGSTSQLVQAIAGFGGGSGAAETLNTAPLSADTSQQSFLTTPLRV
jgi:hypothetical protein